LKLEMEAAMDKPGVAICLTITSRLTLSIRPNSALRI